MVVVASKTRAIGKTKEPPTLDKTKKMIRAVLILCKEGVPSWRLESDYKELARHNIQFQEFGFGSLNDFLESIPDVVQIHRNYGGTTYHAVVTGETQHLHKMIVKQKTSKKKKVTSYKGYKPAVRHQQFRHNDFVQRFQNHWYSQNHINPTKKAFHNHRASVNHLSHTGIQVLSKSQMQTRSFHTQKHNINLPNETKIVPERPSTARFGNNQNATKTLLPTPNESRPALLPTPKKALLPTPPFMLPNQYLMSRKPALLPTPNESRPALLPTPKKALLPTPPFMLLNQYLMSRKPALLPTPGNGLLPTPSRSSLFMMEPLSLMPTPRFNAPAAVKSKNASAFKNPLMKNGTDCGSRQKSEEKLKTNSIENSEHASDSKNSSNISPKADFKDPFDIKREFEMEIPGTFNFNAMKKELSDNFQDNFNNNSCSFLSSSIKTEEKFNVTHPENEFDNSASPLVQNYQNICGLKPPRLKDVSRGNSEDTKELKSRFLELEAGDCSYIKNEECRMSEMDSSSNSYTSTNFDDMGNQSKIASSESHGFGLTESTASQKSPAYVLSPVKSIFKITEFGKFVDVIVTAVSSPWKFFIMPLEKLPAFEDYSYGLNKHFVKERNLNSLRMSLLQEGSICAALCTVNDVKSWERVKVCKIVKNFASVFLIDRAIMDCVPLDNIKDLPPQFQSQTPFVMQVKLAGIKPVVITKKGCGEEVIAFDNDLLTAKLQDRVLNKTFVAHVIKSNVVEGELVYDVCLCDTTHSDHDVWLNDLIVEDWKLAEYIVKV